jgi:hypothetical protein
MLSLSVAGLGVGLVGTWKASGRSTPLLWADALSLLVVGLYMLNH